MASKRDERKRLREGLAAAAEGYVKAWRISQSPGGDPLGPDRLIAAALRIHLAVFGKRPAKVKPRFGELNRSRDV